MLKKKKRLSYPMLIALGFFVLISIGTLLLLIPAASRDGEPVRFIEAAFTAVSASCVTGLVVFDTYTQWSLFGQLVILVLIQIGGLGFMTVLTLFSMFLKRKIGLTERSLMRESLNTMYVGGIVRLTRRILLGTLIFEGAGALILSLRFVPQFGFWKGVFCGIFHSVSAFCNAGFDILGRLEPYGSLTSYVGDPIVILTISALIIIGGIGFFVWDDIYEHRLNFGKYSLHTKLVLVSTLVLITLPTVLFLIFENNNLFAGMSADDKLLGAFFSAVTPRTAGFNSVDTTALSTASRLLTDALMFVGGSPGSTAGGVKTTTIVIIILSLVSSLRGREDEEAFGRRLEDGAHKRAMAVVTVNGGFIILASIIICAAQPALDLGDVLFETFSAIGTVGMSTGITRELGDLGLAVTAFLMYAGRVGSLSFALMFTELREVAPLRRPVERVNIG
ncbi:MAG: TrkH family potassium uptake protein [Oscillospiraceae bacterium]|nr:TrkH family potassium uptake protein [Oscillospiraceae bacterium]